MVSPRTGGGQTSCGRVPKDTLGPPESRQRACAFSAPSADLVVRRDVAAALQVEAQAEPTGIAKLRKAGLAVTEAGAGAAVRALARFARGAGGTPVRRVGPGVCSRRC